MKDNNYTTATMHDMLDRNRDGMVDTKEFVDGLAGLGIPGLASRDFVLIFEAIDVDNSKYLSLNEFALFLEGASKKREQRIRELPADVDADIERQIRELFTIFDEDGNGFIDRHELMKTFQGLGYEVDEAKAEAMIQSVDTDGDMRINLQEFQTLMKPEMQNRLLEQDDRVEDFRAMFRDADTDYSGYLSADEVYTVLLKHGIDLAYGELVELINEFDVSGDAQLDIDEFVAMMNTSSDMAFHSQGAKQTYLKIRQSRRLNVTDFMKALKNMPSAFVPSVFHAKWVKESKHRPSDVLKAQLDPLTMTWRDMLPVVTEQLSKEMHAPANRPKIRPAATQLGCEIAVEWAAGIPLPQNSADFDRNMIKMRAVRIGIFDSARREYLANAVQIEAKLQANTEDKWVFAKSSSSLNPVLFRSTRKDDLDVGATRFVFEFVIYYQAKNAASCTELSCGWAMTDDLSCANRSLNNFKLQVRGGSPTTEIII